MHIKSNFLRKFKTPYLQKLIINIVTIIMNDIRRQFVNTRCVISIYTNELYDYNSSRVHQFGLEGTHNLSITVLIKATYYWLNKLFTKKRVKVEACISAGHNEIFVVPEMPSGLEYANDLRRQHCDCSEFQLNCIPCRHIFACCANQWLDWQVYVHDVYKMDHIRRLSLDHSEISHLGLLTTDLISYRIRLSYELPKMICFLNVGMATGQDRGGNASLLPDEH
ncbi:hypothetical protein Ahy_A02g009162 [Arachis hypogaea]|uniref:SWIM-type domain-containing protein n=1 Tax=Arachis hypogaea TaxID=3818 RepID=A0A445EG03_ARAHY|nr:hypothetical protein Ahy_A02g009162 [Arachis hypogaea]